MAYLLFVDESGYDFGPSPYGVLGAVAIEDRDLWNLVKELQQLEVRHFGVRYSGGCQELKAKKLLSRQVYRKASQLPPIPEDERAILAKRCLQDGAHAGIKEITALAQAKLDYVRDVLDICARFRCKAFASIVSKDSPPPVPGHLRKDYAYLFERFFYFLEDIGPSAYGIVVFDELSRIESHLLVDQMDRYFKLTARGRQRSSQILPEPLFVHSDLTTGVQVADLIAYIVSWGVRFPGMREAPRAELTSLAVQVCQLRYRTVREVEDNPNFVVWSFAIITDLRSRSERLVEELRDYYYWDDD